MSQYDYILGTGQVLSNITSKLNKVLSFRDEKAKRRTGAYRVVINLQHLNNTK
jgi:hypothetical protein